ncbi:MAG: hypothetical protein V1778_02480 [bacterium]
MNALRSPSLRRHLSLLILPILLLLAAFGCRKNTGNTNTTNSVDGTVNVVTPANAPSGATVNSGVNAEQPNITKLSATEQELTRLASAFAERYGSYSNQTDYDNLESLYVFMTPSLQRATEKYVAAERAKKRDTSIYYGITARAAAIATKRFQEGGTTASFLVSTFRKETIGSSGNVATFRQDVLVDMVKTGDAWRIDQVTWQPRTE